MKLINSKKAVYAADTAPFYMIFAVVVTGLFLMFLLIVNSNASNLIEVNKDLGNYFLYQRFLTSPDCFTYEDISGKVYPMNLDFSKFTQYSINNCYNSFNNQKLPAFRLKLSFSEKESVIKTDNWNDNKPVQKRNEPMPVIVLSQNKKYKGDLSIEMQNV